MAKKGKKPAKTCADCIHEFACSMWNIGYIHNMDATNCTNHETIKDCSSYFIGFSDGQKSKPLNGWISVLDRLPEAGEHYQSDDVLVCIDYRPNDPGITEDTYVSIDHVDFNCFGQGCFSCERDDPRDGEPSPYFVTHWQPLPEPPET